jgi:hypothetical protein
MSEQNVQRVRALLEGKAGVLSFSYAATFFDLAVELESGLSSVEGAPYRERRGIEQWLRDIDEQFVDWRMDPDDVREADGRVIATGTVSGRGRGSGIPLQDSTAMVIDFGDSGLIVRARIYFGDAAKALMGTDP